jgi:hypothetical protein
MRSPSDLQLLKPYSAATSRPASIINLCDDDDAATQILPPTTNGTTPLATALPQPPQRPQPQGHCFAPHTVAFPPAQSVPARSQVPLLPALYQQNQVVTPAWPGPTTFADILILRSPMLFSLHGGPPPSADELSSLAVDDLTALQNTELFVFQTRGRLPMDPPVAPSCTVYVQRLRERNSPLIADLIHTVGMRCLCCRFVSSSFRRYQPGSAHFLRELIPEAVHSTLNLLKKHILHCEFANSLVKAKVDYQSTDRTILAHKVTALDTYLASWIDETKAKIRVLATQPNSAKPNSAKPNQYLPLQQQIHVAHPNTKNGTNQIAANTQAKGQVTVPRGRPPKRPTNGTIAVASQSLGRAVQQVIEEKVNPEDEISMELDDILNRAITYHDTTMALQSRPRHGRLLCSTLTTISTPKEGESAFVVMVINRLEMVQCYVGDSEHRPKRPRLSQSSSTDVSIQCCFCKGQEDKAQASRVSLSPFIGRSQMPSTEGSILVCRIGYSHMVNCPNTPQHLRRRLLLYRPAEGSESFNQDMKTLGIYFAEWLAWACKNVLPICKSKELTPVSPRKDVQLWVPTSVSAETSRSRALEQLPITSHDQNQAPLKDNRDDEETLLALSLVGPNDVILDGYDQNHDGNRRFWALIGRWRYQYLSASQSQQLTIVHQIIFEIINHRGGRFVIADKQGPQTLSDDLLIKRVSQALEEGFLTRITSRTSADHDEKRPGSGVLDLESGPFRDLLFDDIAWGGSKATSRGNEATALVWLRLKRLPGEHRCNES